METEDSYPGSEGPRTILVMRHAKARQDDGALDHERKLTGRGKRDARRIGEELRSRDLMPDAIIASTAKRTRGTARRVAEACGYDGAVELNPGLYLEGLDRYLRALAAIPDAVERVLIIAHNPTLEALVDHLTGRVVTLPTAAVATIDLPAVRWPDVARATRGVLRLVLTPRELS